MMWRTGRVELPKHSLFHYRENQDPLFPGTDVSKKFFSLAMKSVALSEPLSEW